MFIDKTRYPPGRVRDAILEVLGRATAALPVKEIEARVRQVLGPTVASSVRSYLRLNTPSHFRRVHRGCYGLQQQMSLALPAKPQPVPCSADVFRFGGAELHHADCFDWLQRRGDNSLHAVVTDPPYGLHEYSSEQQEKLRAGKGGV